jgi:group I intron endonuclease
MKNYNTNYKIIPKVTYSNAYKDKLKIYKENVNKWGIYRWYNIVTGKTYVGSSINFTRRFSIYYSKKAMLRQLSTGISIIYSAILKHGYNNFSLDILEYCEIDMLIEREQYYLDLLNPKYNILKVANSRLGRQSDATKIKISISQRGEYNHFYGKTHTYETRKKIQLSLKSIIRVNKPKVVTLETKLLMSLRCKGVSVKVYDKSNNLINEFLTIGSAAKYFGVSPRTIGRYLNKDKSYNGFVFKSNV